MSWIKTTIPRLRGRLFPPIHISQLPHPRFLYQKPYEKRLCERAGRLGIVSAEFLQKPFDYSRNLPNKVRVHAPIGAKLYHDLPEGDYNVVRDTVVLKEQKDVTVRENNCRIVEEKAAPAERITEKRGKWKLNDGIRTFESKPKRALFYVPGSSQKMIDKAWTLNVDNIVSTSIGF